MGHEANPQGARDEEQRLLGSRLRAECRDTYCAGHHSSERRVPPVRKREVADVEPWIPTVDDHDGIAADCLQRSDQSLKDGDIASSWDRTKHAQAEPRVEQT